MLFQRCPVSVLLPALLCFLAEGESEMLDNFEAIVSLLDFTLNSKRKRHIVGGILLSVSFMFGGLALTTMTLKCGEDNDE